MSQANKEVSNALFQAYISKRTYRICKQNIQSN